MENIYSLITPIVLSLVFIEIIYSLILKRNYFSFQDSVANIGTAVINQCMNMFVLFLVLKSYGFLYENYRINTIENNAFTWVILLVAIDFLFYWFHRWGHTINILWAAHSPHHSSEEMNLMVGLRASLTQRLFSFTLYWPLTLIGYKPEIIYMMTGIHLLLGFWHHTRVIGKLGWFEEIFNTPSHHRVHHGTNEKYLDKNFSEVLILWDRFFGTFQREEEPVCYGILRHPGTWSPLGINFHFWGLLYQDMKETPKWWDKIRLWFMPLGWRPPGVRHREPVKAYTLKEQIKFTTPMAKNMKSYLVLNILLSLLIMYLAITKSFGFSAEMRIFMTAILFSMTFHWHTILENKTMQYGLGFVNSLLHIALLYILPATVNPIFISILIGFILLNLALQSYHYLHKREAVIA
ncbi:MAG: sterol desaturase family protein [Halobacteriovoraceae bacterium]|nr:sterol desaturase family protein [Halobacteriovoraceae bacterium]